MPSGPVLSVTGARAARLHRETGPGTEPSSVVDAKYITCSAITVGQRATHYPPSR